MTSKKRAGGSGALGQLLYVHALPPALSPALPLTLPLTLPI